MIKSIRSTVKLSKGIKEVKIYRVGEVIEYQDSFFEVLAILNFHIKNHDSNVHLIVDYICQDLKFMPEKKAKTPDMLTPLLHTFCISFDISDQETYKMFRLGKGFPYRGRYYQMMRYQDIDIKLKQNRIYVIFETLPIDPLPGQDVRKKFRKAQLNKLKSYQTY